MAGELSEAELRIVARLVNEASAPLRALEAEVTSFGVASQRSFDAAQKSVSAMDQSVKASADHARAAAAEIAAANKERAARPPATTPEAQAEKDRADALLREAEASALARKRIEEYVAALVRQREALTLSEEGRRKLAALDAAEQATARLGVKLRDDERSAILREVGALESARTAIRSEAEAKAQAEAARARAVALRDAEQREIQRSKSELQSMVSEIDHERQLLRLDSNEREVAIARRRAEAVAIRGGIADRRAYVDQVERSVRALQSERAALAPRAGTGGGLSGILGLATQGSPVLGQVVQQAQQGAQALAGMADQGQASAAALVAIGATAAGVAAVGAALAFAAREGLQLTTALRPAVTISAEAATNIDRLRQASHDFAVQLATDSADAGAAISAAYQAGARSAEDAIELARAAADAQALGLGTQAQAVEKIDAVLDIYRLKIRDSAVLTRELWVAAREGEQTFGTFTDAVALSGIAARQLGFSVQETAAVLSVMTRNGLTAQQAGAGLNQVLLKLGDADDQTRLRLEGFGLDLSEEARAAGGIIGVFTQLEEIARRRPEILQQLFGSPRTARAIFAATDDGAREARATLQAMQDASADAGAAIERSLNEPSQRLLRTWTSIKEGLTGVGGGIASVLADIFGTEAPVVDAESEAVRGMRRQIAEAIAADDNQALDIATKGLQRLIDDAWNRVTGVEQHALPFQVRPGTDGKPVDIEEVWQRPALRAQRALLDAQDQALVTKRAIDVVNETAQQLRKPLRELQEDGTIRLVVEAPKEEPRITPRLDFDKLRDDINRTLRGDPLVVPIELQIEPDAVRQARTLLEFFKDTPQAKISSVDQQSIQAAITVIREFDEARKTSLDVEGRLRRASLEGLEREIAERAAARQQVTREIAELERKGVVVDNLRRAQAEANAQESDRTLRDRDQRTLAQRSEILASIAREAEARARVAAEGIDQAEADRAQAAAITAKASAAQAAAESANAAALNAARGNREQEETARRLNEQRLLGVQLERQASEETLRREFRERQREGTRQIADLQSELTQGVDAEVQAIERSITARRDAARQAEAARKIETSDLETILRLLNLIEDEQTAIARIEADAAVREQIAQLQSETSTAINDQANAARELRAIDADRLLLTAKQNGATEEQLRQIEELLRLQGQFQDARTRGDRLFGGADPLQLGVATRLEFDEAQITAEVRDKIQPLLDQIRVTLSDETIPDDVVVERIRRIREEIKLLEVEARRSNENASRVFLDSIRDRGEELGDTVRTFAELGRASVDNLQNSIAGFFDRIVISGASAKQSLKDFFREFVVGMARALNQAVAAEAASGLIRLLAGVGRTAASAGTNIPGDQLVTNAAGLPVLARGGVVAHQLQDQVRVPGHAQPLPIRQYRIGGIATEPQVAIYGEGDGAEAYVPLPGPNRGIPVELRGRRGSNTTFHATFNITGTDPRTLRDQMAEIAPELAAMVADVVHRGESRVARQRLGHF